MRETPCGMIARHAAKGSGGCSVVPREMLVPTGGWRAEGGLEMEVRLAPRHVIGFHALV